MLKKFSNEKPIPRAELLAFLAEEVTYNQTQLEELGKEEEYYKKYYSNRVDMFANILARFLENEEL